MSQLPTLVLETVFATIPVVLVDANKVETKWEIREIDGHKRDKYLNALSKKSKTSADGASRIMNFDGLQAQLLLVCLFNVAESRYATLEDVQAWPAKVQTALFKNAQKLNGLEDEKDKDKDGTDSEDSGKE